MVVGEIILEQILNRKEKEEKRRDSFFVSSSKNPRKDSMGPHILSSHISAGLKKQLGDTLGTFERSNVQRSTSLSKDERRPVSTGDSANHILDGKKNR